MELNKSLNMLVVIDMQNDFIDGALGSAEAAAALQAVRAKIAAYRENNLPVVFTRDGHSEDYLLTQEGRKLPIEHCIRGTRGWQIADGLYRDGDRVFDKSCYGSTALAEYIAESVPTGSVELIGVCTDICVINNAMLIRAFSPETAVVVDPDCCAGATPRGHEIALEAMKACHIEIAE